MSKCILSVSVWTSMCCWEKKTIQKCIITIKSEVMFCSRFVVDHIYVPKHSSRPILRKTEWLNIYEIVFVLSIVYICLCMFYCKLNKCNVHIHSLCMNITNKCRIQDPIWPENTQAYINVTERVETITCVYLPFTFTRYLTNNPTIFFEQSLKETTHPKWVF